MECRDQSTGVLLTTPARAGDPALGRGNAWGDPRSKNLGVLLAAISLPLLPFAFHRSGHPSVFIYSMEYLLFLVGLAVAGVAMALFLRWLVRNAEPGRQLPLALCTLALILSVPLGAEVSLSYKEGDVFADHYQWGHQRSPFMGFELGPERQVVRMDDYGAPYTISTDASCFRTHVTPRVSRDRETLIVVIGGSSAFGYGLNDDETWAQGLERHLRARFGDEITVLNAANSGHTSLQQLFRLYLRVLPLKPDYVVYYGMVNDVRTNGDIDPFTGQSPLLMDLDLLGIATTRQYVQRKNEGKAWYFRNSLVLNHLKRTYESWRSRPGERDVQRWIREYDDAEFDTAAAAYLRNLDTARLLCKAEGAEFIPVTFIAHSGKNARTGLAYYLGALRKHCLGHNIPLIDLQPAFERVEDKRRLFYKDQYHPSRRGAEFIAYHVAEAITPMIADRHGATPTRRSTSTRQPDVAAVYSRLIRPCSRTLRAPLRNRGA